MPGISAMVRPCTRTSDEYPGVSCAVVPRDATLPERDGDTHANTSRADARPAPLAIREEEMRDSGAVEKGPLRVPAAKRTE